MNEFQQQAVCSDINAPVCIIAGPGSGKTKTIVERVKHIQYTQSHYKPPYSPKMSSSSSAESTTAEVAKILILSFSKSAVTEMKSRLQNENINQQQVHVSTFHGLGYRIITKYWSLLGFTKCPTKCSQKIAYNILKDAVQCTPEINQNTSSNPESFHQLMKVIQFAKTKQNPQQYLLQIYSKNSSNNSNKFNNENYNHNCVFDDGEKVNTSDSLVMLYNSYQTCLKQRNLMEFSDMVAYAYQLICQSIKLRHHTLDSGSSVPLPLALVLPLIQQEYNYICVDEFQDLNNIQTSLLLQLADHGRVTAVGDFDQLIYSFQGADKTNFFRFHSFYTSRRMQVCVVGLKYNYRSNEAIVAASNVIANFVSPGSSDSASGSGRRSANTTNPTVAAATVTSGGTSIASMLYKDMVSMTSAGMSQLSQGGTAISNCTRTGIIHPGTATAPVRVVECLPGQEAVFDYTIRQIHHLLLSPTHTHTHLHGNSSSNSSGNSSSGSGDILKSTDIAVLYRANATGSAFKAYYKSHALTQQQQQQSPCLQLQWRRLTAPEEEEVKDFQTAGGVYAGTAADSWGDDSRSRSHSHDHRHQLQHQQQQIKQNINVLICIRNCLLFALNPHSDDVCAAVVKDCLTIHLMNLSAKSLSTTGSTIMDKKPNQRVKRNTARNDTIIHHHQQEQQQQHPTEEMSGGHGIWVNAADIDSFIESILATVQQCKVQQQQQRQRQPYGEPFNYAADSYQSSSPAAAAAAAAESGGIATAKRAHHSSSTGTLNDAHTHYESMSVSVSVFSVVCDMLSISADTGDECAPVSGGHCSSRPSSQYEYSSSSSGGKRLKTSTHHAVDNTSCYSSSNIYHYTNSNSSSDGSSSSNIIPQAIQNTLKTRIRQLLCLRDRIVRNEETLPRLVERVIDELGVCRPEWTQRKRLNATQLNRHQFATIYTSHSSNKLPSTSGTVSGSYGGSGRGSGRSGLPLSKSSIATARTHAVSLDDSDDERAQQATQFITRVLDAYDLLTSEAQSQSQQEAQAHTRLHSSSSSRPHSTTHNASQVQQFIAFIANKCIDTDTSTAGINIYTDKHLTNVSHSSVGAGAGDCTAVADGRSSDTARVCWHGTVHSAKGKEWRYVFLIDADDATYSDYTSSTTRFLQAHTTAAVSTSTSINNKGTNTNTIFNPSKTLTTTTKSTSHFDAYNNDHFDNSSATASGCGGGSGEMDGISLCIEDSKNLLYVAVSRAREQLTLVYAGQSTSVHRGLSRYLKAVMKALQQQQSQSQSESAEKGSDSRDKGPYVSFCRYEAGHHNSSNSSKSISSSGSVASELNHGSKQTAPVCGQQHSRVALTGSASTACDTVSASVGVGGGHPRAVSTATAVATTATTYANKPLPAASIMSASAMYSLQQQQQQQQQQQVQQQQQLKKIKPSKAEQPASQPILIHSFYKQQQQHDQQQSSSHLPPPLPPPTFHSQNSFTAANNIINSNRSSSNGHSQCHSHSVVKDRPAAMHQDHDHNDAMRSSHVVNHFTSSSSLPSLPMSSSSYSNTNMHVQRTNTGASMAASTQLSCGMTAATAADWGLVRPAAVDSVSRAAREKTPNHNSTHNIHVFSSTACGGGGSAAAASYTPSSRVICIDHDEEEEEEEGGNDIWSFVDS